jgi:hypothetical protein
MAFRDFIGKKVFIEIQTTSGLKHYSGFVTDVVFMGKNTEEVEIWFIEIIDKFGNKVGFSSTSIKLIDEEK